MLADCFHKGGPENPLFLQITAQPDRDMEIPTEGLTFGTLIRAQALGDYEALIEAGRKVLRLHAGSSRDLEKIPSLISKISRLRHKTDWQGCCISLPVWSFNPTLTIQFYTPRVKGIENV